MWRPIETQIEGLYVLGIMVITVIIAIPLALFCVAIFAHIFNAIFHEWDNEEEEDET